MAVVNGFTYHQPQPFDMPGPNGLMTPEQTFAELMRRNDVAAKAFETKQWRGDLEEWDAAVQAAAIRSIARPGDVDLSALDTDALVAHLRDAGEHLTNMSYLHHRFNLSAMLPVGDFALQVAGWLHRDPRQLHAVLDGYSPISAVASDELRPAIDGSRRPGRVGAARLRRRSATRLAELRRAVLPSTTTCASAGHRISDGFDVLFPTPCSSGRRSFSGG